MSWWVTELNLVGNYIDLAKFDNATLIGCVGTSKLVYLIFMAKYEIDKPAKFTV